MPDTPALVTVERRSDGVALVQLDNGKVNALSTALLRRLGDVARELTDDPPGAVVVTGSDRMFAAGADIDEFGGPDEAKVVGEAFHDALNAVAAIPRATIAAVAGFALGGGCEVALACDFRVAASTARFGQPEVLLGVIPGGGATQRLPRLIGPARAKDLILTGRVVDADEAMRIGLVDRVVAAEELLSFTLGWAASLAAGPVQAHAHIKRAVDRGLDITLDGGLELEQQLFVDVFRTDDARIGVESFRQHGPGKAEFSGH